MGYPRKSYPHRCSPPCAKRSRPRACTRVYIIYRSPVGRSRECPRRCGEELAPLWHRVPRRRAQGGGGRRQRREAPSRSAPPLPVRTPRGSLSTAAPLPAYVRITVRKGGSTQGNPRPCPCVLPASARIRPNPCPPTAESLCAKAEVHKAIPAPARAFSPASARLPPRPRRLNGHPASAGGRENDRMAHRRTTTPTHRTPRGNDTCTIRVPRRKGTQSVVHNL